MNIIKKTKEHTTKLSMSGKIKKSYRIYCMVVVIATLIFGASVTAFAANDPIAVINNLSGFIFGLIRAVGLILLGFGVVQVGLSLKSHDPSQRANGFLTLAGGVIITFAKEILNLITSWYFNYRSTSFRCTPDFIEGGVLFERQLDCTKS